MYQYQYVTLIGEGVSVTEYRGRRELIDRYAGQGQRYAGYIPFHITQDGNPVQLDLVFEREV